jgi:CIC family chloride channel protein
MAEDATAEQGASVPPPSVPPPGVTLRFAIALVVVALGAAAFAVAVRTLLGLVFHRLYGADDVVAAFTRLPFAYRIALPAAGGALAGAIQRVRMRGRPGVGGVMEAVVFGRVRLSLRSTLLQSLGSLLAIAGGGSLGREGPIIQCGGAIGAAVGRASRMNGQRIRTLVAAGAGAGFAAAYNTPLAAVLFVLEVVIGIVALDAILPVLAATAIATAFTRALAGGGPIYGQRAFALASQSELASHALLGLIAAIASQAFMRLLSAGERWFERSRIGQPLRATCGGALVGLIACGMPEVTGNGYEPLNALLDGAFVPSAIALMLGAKALATTSSVASGSPGGVFTPTLLLGAGLGSLYGTLLAHAFGGAIGPSGGYALVGMAAMTAATTHAPMMAALLVFELSGDYAIVLPLLLATALATVVSRKLRTDSIYTAELTRRGVGFQLTLEGRKLTGPATTDSRPTQT